MMRRPGWTRRSRRWRRICAPIWRTPSAGRSCKGGYKVAIVGPPNAGKSSLLNALAEREVAIVTEIPGTTRDVIEATLDLDGIPVRFSDTAGIRETADKVEAIGIERARAVMDDADLVLALIDPQAGPGPLARLTDLLTHVKHPMLLAAAGGEIDDVAQTLRRPKRNILTVRTKIDRPERHGIAARLGLEGQAIDFDFSISVKTGEGLAATRRTDRRARRGGRGRSCECHPDADPPPGPDRRHTAASLRNSPQGRMRRPRCGPRRCGAPATGSAR